MIKATAYNGGQKRFNLESWIEDLQRSESIRSIWLEPLTDDEADTIREMLDGNDIESVRKWANLLFLMALARKVDHEIRTNG